MKIQLVLWAVVMMVVAVVADEVSDEDEACLDEFKTLAYENFELPKDIKSFFKSVNEDLHDQLNSVGDEKLAEAAELWDPPSEGCEKVAQFVRKYPDQVQCVEVVKQYGETELIKDMREDEDADDLFKAMIVCRDYI